MDHFSIGYIIVVSCCAIGFALLCITLPIFLCSNELQCCRGNDNNDSGIRLRRNFNDCGIRYSSEIKSEEILREEEHVEQKHEEQKYKMTRINSCP